MVPAKLLEPFYLLMVPLIGIEPIWYHYRMILSHVRLPVPPQRQYCSLGLTCGTINILPTNRRLVNYYLPVWKQSRPGGYLLRR
jgi:hypothetical protein